jgi:predicted TIM-barrel fold metal-dependent hydrolase
MDPVGAVDEIERRAGDGRFVQVAVTTQALHPYGQRQFFPIWRAASEAGLPIHLHADTATGIEYWPTPVGYPSFFAEMSAYQPGNSFIHLESFITEGVFERLPNLRIICGDGGLDLMTPLFWRFDKSWRGLRIETPGAVATPSQYLRDRVRFVWHRWEGSSSNTEQAEWLSMAGGSDLLLYGSNLPYWDLFPAVEATARAEELSMDSRVMGQNAVDFWGGRSLVGGVA